MSRNKLSLVIALSIIFLFSIFYYSLVYAQNTSPPVYASLDSSLYKFELGAYNTTIGFDHDLYFTYPDVYWIWNYNGYVDNTTSITLVGVWMKDLSNTEPINITISSINANITIHSLMQGRHIKLTAYPPSGEYFQLYISVPKLGYPRYITLTYSDGSSIVLSRYIPSKSGYDDAVSKHQTVMYYDTNNKKCMIGSPSHSPVDIDISWETQSIVSTGVPTTPSTQPSQPSTQPSITSKAKTLIDTILSVIEPVLTYLLIILLAIILILIYLFRCSIPLLSKICKR